MSPVEIIKRAYGSMREISRLTGLSYETLRKNRMTDSRIGSMTLNEFWNLQRHAYFTDEEILTIAKWRAESER